MDQVFSNTANAKIDHTEETTAVLPLISDPRPILSGGPSRIRHVRPKVDQITI